MVFAIKNTPREDSDQTAHSSDLNLPWAHMSEGTFSDVTAQMRAVLKVFLKFSLLWSQFLFVVCYTHV